MAGLLANFTLISIILFIIGIVLMFIEMAQPGFGIFGILGIIALLVDIFITAKTVLQGFIMLGIIFAVLLILFIVILCLMSAGKFPSVLLLKETESKATPGVTQDIAPLLMGKQGVAATDLRPAGKAEFDGTVFDVVSQGDFIEKGSAVTVSEISGNRICVVIKNKNINN